MRTRLPKPLFSSLVAGIQLLGIWLIAAAALAPAAHADNNRIYGINCGGSAASPFVADSYYSGGSAYSVSNSITTTGVTNPAPQSVYQTERYGACTYTFPNLASTNSYTVRLHFSENYHTSSGS